MHWNPTQNHLNPEQNLGGKSTAYGKTFKWENFCGFCNFAFNRKYYPMNFLLIKLFYARRDNVAL